ncbi:MAG: hypothetical protein MUO90_01875, partial [Dehalococcoidales bacterium]|nr:hypothetical protein [Dehalococcoidales bacterium]
ALRSGLGIPECYDILHVIAIGRPGEKISIEKVTEDGNVRYWRDDEGVIDKLAEEVGEFKQAQSKERKEEEFGDLLFTLANIARRQGIDLEAALRQTNRRFYQRFNCMEKFCRERGLEFGKLSFDEQNKLWEEAKKEMG